MEEKIWKPTAFMELLIAYENDGSNFDRINQILKSEDCEKYLFEMDNKFTNSVLFSIRRRHKLTKLLINKIRIGDPGYLYMLLCEAIFSGDYGIIASIIDKHGDCMSFNHVHRSSLLMCSFDTGNPEIINLFLDLYRDKYDIFTQRFGKQSVYDALYTEVEPKHLGIVLETLMKHKYYGPILLSKLNHDMRAITKVLPDLVKEKKIEHDKISDIFPSGYINNTVDNIRYFRENCLPEIGQTSLEILYSPKSMEVLKAKYRTMFYKKFGKDKVSDSEKIEYWEIISRDTKFCDYYSILIPDHVDKIFERK